MKTTMDMAREAGADIGTSGRWLITQAELEQLVALVRADERAAQPAQKPDIYPEEARDMGLEERAYYTTPPAAQPAQEPHNFCPRCGKRLEGVLGRPQMHTCTPPLWGHT